MNSQQQQQKKNTEMNSNWQIIIFLFLGLYGPLQVTTDRLNTCLCAYKHNTNYELQAKEPAIQGTKGSIHQAVFISIPLNGEHGATERAIKI